MPNSDISRRTILKSAAWTSLALVLPFSIPDAAAKDDKNPAKKSLPLEPNAFLTLEPDNTVTIYAKHLEMGQGVYTGLSTILADELDADWDLVRVVSAPANPNLYNNLFRGKNQGTGGSNSIANSWMQLRVAGAQARMMLLAAAVETWKVPASELTTEKSQVLHPPSGRKISYGALVEKARHQTIPFNPPLKKREEFRLIGHTRKQRIDGREKTAGKAQFGIDTKETGKIVALVARPPLFGAQVKDVQDKAARGIKGVLEVLKIPQGVAVLAEDFWTAKKAREALEITWDEAKAFKGSTADLERDFTAALSKTGAIAFSQGAWEGAREKAAKSFEAVYMFPYLAHAPLEPLNCVIKTDEKSCEIWSGSQSQTRDQTTAAGILGMSPDDVVIHTTLAGGSFGRRSNPTSDYVAEAAQIAKATAFKKRPIHLMWTREDDIRGGYYRPFTMHRVVAGIDENGKPLFWHHRIATQSMVKALLKTPPKPDYIDPSSVEGAEKIPYPVPHRQCELHTMDVPVSVLWWRSVGHNHTAFVVESVIDELAALAGKDPLAYRLDLLAGEPRQKAVLQRVAEMAGWERAIAGGMASGRGIGVAMHTSFGTTVAQVAQVFVKDGQYKVEKVWCAIDCGIAVNPDIVKAQMEGGIGFALSAIQREAIHLKNGRVEESNFHDYQPLRMTEMPQIEVDIISSDKDPTGVGEPGVPPLGPAVANALAKATGKRLRSLPLKLT